MRARLKALPPSPHNTITVAQDESHEKNVCIKRRTEFMIASCGDLSTHFNAKTILRHTSRLGSRWTPPPHSLKPMPLHLYDPWHLFQSKTNSSLRTLAAHKARFRAWFSVLRDISSCIEGRMWGAGGYFVCEFCCLLHLLLPGFYWIIITVD